VVVEEAEAVEEEVVEEIDITYVFYFLNVTFQTCYLLFMYGFIFAMLYNNDIYVCMGSKAAPAASTGTVTGREK